MKKALSLILSILVILSCLTGLSSAVENDIPLIVVTGYGTPALFENYGEKEQSRAWVFSPADALLYTLKDVKNLLPATASFLEGKGDKLGHCISEAGKSIMPYMYCNPDGSSVGNITPMPNDPEKTTYAVLKGTLEAYEPFLCADIVGKYISEDKIFIFQYDFRMSVYDISDQLNDYVNAVLKYTGAKKADLFALSFGGLITGTYLTRFGTKGKLQDVVMSVPALGGTTFATTFMEGKAEIPVTMLLQYLNSALNLEVDVYQLARLLDGADAVGSTIDSSAVEFLTNIGEMPRYWCSLWDLLPVDDYTRLKAELLDETENAEIIRKSDYIHYNVMANYTKNFKACMKKGVNISIFTSSGKQNCFGSTNNADALVDVKFGSGATCTDLGKRFSDGYTGVGTVCKSKTHKHVSPGMNVDASSAYLPENTWFVDGQGHGMYSAEEWSMSLIEKLLFSGEKINVHTYPEYPQFMTSQLALYGVYAKFDSSVNGRIKGKDTALVITNESKLHPTTITSVKADGIDLTFDLSEVKTLLPGESVRIPFEGNIPKVGAVHVGITVEFVRTGCLTPCGVRVFDFTVENGDAVDYDGGTEDTAEAHVTLDLKEIVQRVISSFFTAFTDILSRIVNAVKDNETKESV